MCCPVFWGGPFRLEKKRYPPGSGCSKDALAAYADVGEVWMGHVDHPSTVEPNRPLGGNFSTTFFPPVGHLQWWVSKGNPQQKKIPLRQV